MGGVQPALARSECDILIIGGGVNGAGIARDAAGRGLSVMLVEQDDLASHTSSASTKLIHGGLRYLEHFEFRLVREALIERERLIAIAPHIIERLDFVLPHVGDLLPAWMIRLGLFLYDHLGGRNRFPRSRSVRLDRSPLGAPLRRNLGRGFVYSDCRVDDSRLVILNAVDAAERGAAIRTRTRFLGARAVDGGWEALIDGGLGQEKVRARAIVNAAGPWAGEVLGAFAGDTTDAKVRLVKGSHIVLPKLYPGDHAYVLQSDDRRIVFAIPYEGEYTLVGTTDVDWPGAPGVAAISDGEIDYLLGTVTAYFGAKFGRNDILWSYAGVRPLHDDEAANAAEVTRDYRLVLTRAAGAPLLTVIGGKITTYRRLAEEALAKLAPVLAADTRPWTMGAVLPGGDLPGADLPAFTASVRALYPDIPSAVVARLCRSYGTRVRQILCNASGLADLGVEFGSGLYAAEVDYLIHHEGARTAEDILFRRTKLGPFSSPEVAARLTAYLKGRTGDRAVSFSGSQDE
jgi:glycerol-3-phosphate dehydrogenase